MEPSIAATTAFLALLLAVPAAGIAASRGFDGLYGQDPYAYFDYSMRSVRQSLLHLAPLGAFFWPPGYPLLVALASLVTGTVPLAGQAVSLAMGAFVPAFTALLVREVLPEKTLTALLAGALVAVCGQLWQSSTVVMADTTGLALATFSAYALARYARTARAGWLVAASAALAYATLARWIFGLVGVPFAAYALWSLMHVDRRRALGTGALAAVVGAVIVVPVVFPSLIGLLTQPGQPAAFAGNFQVYSWSPLNAFRRDFFTADGHLEYTLPNGVYYAIAPANFAFFGPLLAPWIFVGLWTARRWPRPLLMLIVGWAAIVYAFHAGAPWQNFRFTLAYLPPLAILLASGLAAAWRLVQPRLRSLIAVWAAAGLLTTFAAAVRLVEGFINQKDNELALVRWVQTQSPPPAEVFSFGPTLAFRHYSDLPTHDLFDLSPADVRAILVLPGPDYLLIEPASVEDQWLGQPPSDNFHLLRDGPGLTQLGTEYGYTLFRVGSG